MTLIRPIILCGGSGSRLWPESRVKLPKQFIPIKNNKSLFDFTLERIKKLKTLKPIIITNEKYKYLTEDSLLKNKFDATIILEPIGKNTAPAIYLASKISNKNDQLVIMPSDHYIGKNKLLIEALQYISKQNILNDWVTLGIKPNSPSTSYGYLKLLDKKNKNKLFKVKQFIEKPNINRAKTLYKSKNILWNSGIFIGYANMITKCIELHEPILAKKCVSALKNSTHLTSKDQYTFCTKMFKDIPSKSIDTAIMEKSKNIYCYQTDCEWSDVGSWERYFECFPAKKSNKIIQVNSKNNSIKGTNRLIATVGVKDLVIIDNKDATLIAKKGLEERMRDLISILKKNNISEIEENTFENRPWGKFENLFISPNIKIKQITVNPKSRLSKQFHYFRSEHWFVTKGRGYVYKDGNNIILKKGQSVDIPKKCVHYIENKSDKVLTFIEIQMGTYFGEDDIVRLDDIYGR
tara:strand:- start:619 stop:2010 length:1392 start_codon:yes stop_codon:yes gene_type:complete